MNSLLRYILRGCYYRDHCACCPLGELGDRTCRDDRCPPKSLDSEGDRLWRSWMGEGR